MIKICEICNGKFETKSATRIYCYNCSGESTRNDNATRKHQKTILRRNMKLQLIIFSSFIFFTKYIKYF